MTGLTYREPLHLVRGDGVWLIDADGRRYLDAYNNVPVVGHGHPRVVEAIVRQARRLNTNMRYLHETALEVAERLIASTGGALDVVMFVNSGSEANDIAWRIARAVTGGSGGIATDYAYHGITEAINALTPEDWGSRPGARPRAHLAAARRAARLRRQRRGLRSRPIRELERAGHPPAAAILDGVLTSDGIIDLDPSLAAELVRRTHEAGALWIADEVQGGYGRTGAAMWSLPAAGHRARHRHARQADGQRPPGRRGHHPPRPRRALLAEGDFFSTFGGNPVAMAAALAVLEVIDDERIIEQRRRRRGVPGGRLREVAARIAADRRGPRRSAWRSASRSSSPARPSPTRRRPRRSSRACAQRGVLIGTTGRHGNTLKIRPPLVFQRQHADQLAATLDEVLGSTVRGDEPN